MRSLFYKGFSKYRVEIELNSFPVKSDKIFRLISTYFSTNELKAQVSFIDRLLPSIRLSVRLLVCGSVFKLLN